MEINAKVYSLYMNIMDQIEQNGGIDETLVNVSKEWPELFGYNYGVRGVWVYNARAAKVKYSESENDFIRANWAIQTLQTIGNYLNRSRGSISNQGYILGLPDRPNLSGRRKKHKII